jgi:hypothetical protein
VLEADRARETRRVAELPVLVEQAQALRRRSMQEQASQHGLCAPTCRRVGGVRGDPLDDEAHPHEIAGRSDGLPDRGAFEPTRQRRAVRSEGAGRLQERAAGVLARGEGSADRGQGEDDALDAVQRRLGIVPARCARAFGDELAEFLHQLAELVRAQASGAARAAESRPPDLQEGVDEVELPQGQREQRHGLRAVEPLARPPRALESAAEPQPRVDLGREPRQPLEAEPIGG